MLHRTRTLPRASLVAPLIAMLFMGCASATTPAASETTPSTTATAPPTADELVGYWAEYWALRGKLETQRHVFLPDGRWGWLGGPDAPGQRAGSWRLEDGALLLESQAGTQRVEVNGCPDNSEAQQLDASYRCLSLDGRAFWRHAGPDQGDATPFFP